MYKGLFGGWQKIETVFADKECNNGLKNKKLMKAVVLAGFLEVEVRNQHFE